MDDYRFKYEMDGRYDSPDYDAFNKIPYKDRPRRLEEYWKIQHLDADRNQVFADIKATYKDPNDDLFDFWAYFIGAGEDDPTGLCPANKSHVGFITKDAKLARELIDGIHLDFLFDRATGYFFMDMRSGHEIIMSHLYEARTGKRSSSHFDNAHQYLQADMGFFNSSTNNIVWFGEDAKIPPEYKKMVSHVAKRMDRRS